MTTLTAEELDQRISHSIAHATTELREEFRAQLQEIRRGTDSRVLLNGLREIDAATSQAEILQALLVATQPHAAGAAIVLNASPALRGWGMRGAHGGQGVENIELAITPGSAWSRVVEGEGVVVDRIDDLYAALGASNAEPHALLPLVLRGQVAAVVAVEGSEDVAAVQILTHAASQAIETLAVRTPGANPTLRAPEVSAAAPTPQVAVAAPIDPAPPADPTSGPPAAPPVESAPAPEPGPMTESQAWANEALGGPAPAPPIDESVAPELTPVEEPTPFTDDLRTVAVDPTQLESAGAGAIGLGPSGAPSEPQPAAPIAPSAPPPADADPGAAGLAMGADGQIIPPDDVQGPGWAFSNTNPQESGSQEDAHHDEARRLARLLVSEIKLYNEEQVEEGRQSKNIYARLREDIDRSQQIYEERIHPSIRGKTDFFRDELVRILAGGDADVLGT